MGFWNKLFKGVDIDSLDESLKPFENRQSVIKTEKEMKRKHGEGIEDFSQMASGFGVFGSTEVKSYSNFYKKFLDSSFKNEIDKLYEYRNISRYPEIAEVLEDAVNESTQRDLSRRHHKTPNSRLTTPRKWKYNKKYI